jgi:hypothetical protein
LAVLFHDAGVIAMLTPEQISSLRPKLQITQLVAGALIGGVLVFAAIVCVLNSGQDKTPVKLLTLMAAVTAAALFALSVVAPSMFAAAPLKSDDLKDSVLAMANSLMTETLIRFSLIEAAIFLNLTVFFIAPDKISLIVAAAGVLLMLLCFPLQSRMITVIEDRLS